MPLQGPGKIGRHGVLAAEEIDLDHEELSLTTRVEDVLEGRVGDDTSVPVRDAADENRRKSRRQRAARHDVLGSDALPCTVEVDGLAAFDLDRTDRETHRARVEQFEI